MLPKQEKFWCQYDKQSKSERRQKMLCQFERLIYPHDVSTAANGQYMVAVYNPLRTVPEML